MTKNKLNEILIYIFFWGGLVVIWNYGYTEATPLQDVLAAFVILIITRIVLKKFSKQYLDK
ncbi:hypothetical protein KKG41_05105 [Patescibacteria group bacterium]|nr:hypothetical protein [Patescibacteria group bacterium]MBU1891134.1 hypothetical protein [Patescibacteria group bacterium]